MYSPVEKLKAINYYFQQGTNISKTVKALGYPCRQVLKSWIVEKYPNQQKKLFSK